MAGRARLRTNLDGMRATLEKIKAVAEVLAGDPQGQGRDNREDPD